MSKSRLVDRVSGSLSRPDATLFIAVQERTYFVGEALLVAAAICAAEQFFSGFLKELGVEDLGAETARRLKNFVLRLAAGPPDPAVVEEEAVFLDRLETEASRHAADTRKRAVSVGQTAVQDFLIERGATRAQAAEIAGSVAKSALHEAGNG